VNHHRKPRELTGKHVLLCFVGFFGVVFAVNGVLVRAATSTFGGVETTSSYKAGLLFEQEVARVEQQDALHWRVDGKIVRESAGVVVLDVSAHDAKGVALDGLTGRARLAHPADERLDRQLAMSPVAGGQFRGEGRAEPGQWELVIDLYRGDTRVFRSRSRVTLR
jgi:nitrogen fixation protein FixH